MAPEECDAQFLPTNETLFAAFEVTMGWASTHVSGVVPLDQSGPVCELCAADHFEKGTAQ